MTRLVFIVVAVLVSVASADPAKDIVVAADRARNPQVPFHSTLTLVNFEHAKARDQVTLAIDAKIDGTTGQFKNLVRYVDPPRDAGKLVLLDASKMWFYDPASKTSVRISPQQRLTGQASTGDVLTVNLARDYTATLIGEDAIKDADHHDRQTWHLDLAAATSDAMYGRLEYWVERGTYRTIKAKFYSDSGRLTKIAYYRKFADVLGTQRPMETVIIDAIDTSLVTTVASSDVRERELPDAWFQRDYLPHIRAE